MNKTEGMHEKSRSKKCNKKIRNLTCLCQPNHTNLWMSETSSWDA
uniref:Uncharacterized protein n=1 Tax=Arundo donax TaxID=35708 RepID=A0A0A9EHF3_ARUDO